MGRYHLGRAPYYIGEPQAKYALFCQFDHSASSETSIRCIQKVVAAEQRLDSGYEFL